MDNVYLIKPDGKKKILCSTGKPGSMTYHRLNIKLNEAGSMEVHIPASNAKQENIAFLMDEISFERNGVELFRGEAVNKLQDIVNTGEIKVKGAFDYFSHVYMEPYQFSGSPEEYLQLLIDHYNSRVLPNKRIYKGIMTVTDPNNYITRSNSERVLISKLLKEKLVDNMGGFMRIRIMDGLKYLDYLAEFETVSSQKILYGGNILDISQEIEYGDVATVIVPVGAKDEETGEYLSIESVNDGLPYYADMDAVALYGWREVSVKWEDVTLPENLLKKAKEALKAYVNPVKSVSVKAVDLSQQSDEVDCFHLGDNIETASSPHGINDIYMLSAMELYALSPESEILTLGGEKPVTITIGSAIDSLKEDNSIMRKSNWDLANRIENADGLYATEIVRDDGSVIKYMHNRPSLSDSNLQISFSTVGIFLSADYGNNWYGFQMDGNTIVNVLQAYGINADIIKGGTLVLGGEGNGNGRERIYDKDGNLIATLNNLGIRTYSVNDSNAVTVMDGGGIFTRRLVADEEILFGSAHIIVRSTGGLTFQKANASASDVIHTVITEKEDEEVF